MNYNDYVNKDQVKEIADKLKELNLSVVGIGCAGDRAVSVETKIKVKGRKADIAKLKEMGFEMVWRELFCGAKYEIYRKPLEEG